MQGLNHKPITAGMIKTPLTVRFQESGSVKKVFADRMTFKRDLLGRKTAVEFLRGDKVVGSVPLNGTMVLNID